MNFHPDILSQAAFLDRPRSCKQLYKVIGLIEEMFSVLKERQCSDHDAGVRVVVQWGPGGCPTWPSRDQREQWRLP